VAGFAAFFAHRSLHSRAVVSVVALRLERAFAIGALVLWTREAQSAFVGRAATIAAWSTFGCRVSGCTALVAHAELAPVYAQILCIACNMWRTRCGRCGAIQNHNERKPWEQVIA
jgi:hypothetical protein